MNGYPISLLVITIFSLVWVGAGLYSWLAGPKRQRAAPELPARSMGKVLVLTAAVGGGHEEAGRTVRTELERAGYAVAMTDGLGQMSRTLDWLLVRGYRRQVTGIPRTLGAVFAVTSLRAGAAAVRSLVGLLFAKRLLRRLSKESPDLVISTYPLVTSALGRLRKDGSLHAPVVAVVPDYGVHPLWVDPHVDMHLVVSQLSAALAERAGGTASAVRLPVAPAFREAPAREEARNMLGLPREGFVILVVGGAWGIGNLEEAARCAAGANARTIVVTGSNTALQKRLTAEFSCEENVQILGWRDDLPILMAAADCMIQNAGGMTCLEAIERGLPILMFDPIRGHGEFNSRIMERAGVASWVRSADDLSALLGRASRQEILLPAPRTESFAPTVSDTVAPLIQNSPQPTVRQRSPSLAPRPALLTGVAVLASLLWLAFASPGVALAARELHLQVPGYAPSPGNISLGVRVDDPATAAALESVASRKQVPLTIFATSQGAKGLHPAANIAFGVAEDPAGDRLPSLHERRKATTAADEIQRSTGTYPGYFLAIPRPDLAAFAEAPPDTRMVMPERTSGDRPHTGLLILDASNLGPEAARGQFLQTLQKIRHGGFRCVPLSRL